jgi:hypothetical protein
VTRTREFLQSVGGEVWITEVGGAVKRPRGQAKFPEGLKHAARVTRFIFEDLARLSPRITRIYLYHWSSAGPGSSWDSGLVGADGRPRPALTVFEQMLGKGKAPKPGKPVVPGKPAKPAPGKPAKPAPGMPAKPGKQPAIEGTIPARA